MAGGGLLPGERLSGAQWIGVAIVVGVVIAILRRTDPYGSTVEPTPISIPA